jgi:hypothetical protein
MPINGNRKRKDCKGGGCKSGRTKIIKGDNNRMIEVIQRKRKRSLTGILTSIALCSQKPSSHKKMAL